MLLLFDDAQQLVKTHHCRQCGHKAMLVARAVPGDNRLNVVCGGCGSDEHLERDKSLTQRWRESPESVPIHTANKLAEKYGVEPMTETALAVASERQMAERIKSARWLTELKPEHHQALAHLSVRYGLDPLMKELTMYEGSPYISVAGLIRIAHRQTSFAGIEDRPMSQEEKQQYGYKAPFCWIVKVYRADWRVPAVGTGTGDPQNPLRNNPVERVRPEWMARARALRQALKLAYPHSLPFAEMESAEEAGIDPETGAVAVAVIDRPASTSPTVIDREPIIAAEWRESELPLDSSDSPEPTALEEHAKAEAEFIEENRLASRRQELLDALRELAPKKWKGGWANLQVWWGSYFPDTPETADVATLEQAYARLTNTKAAGHAT